MKDESNTKKIFEWYNFYQNKFIKDFQFYLQFLDKIFQIPQMIKVPDEIFENLPETDKKFLSIYRMLNDSATTTTIGAIRLFSSNIYSDTFSLLRILVEVLSLMHFGSKSRDNKKELLAKFFGENKKIENKPKSEWEFLKRTKKILIDDFPKIKELFDYLNDFGSHISVSKIVYGNIENIQGISISSFYNSNFRDKHFLYGLNQLVLLYLNIETHFAIHYKEYVGVSVELEKYISELTPEFVNTIQPKLLALQND